MNVYDFAALVEYKRALRRSMTNSSSAGTMGVPHRPDADTPEQLTARSLLAGVPCEKAPIEEAPHGL